MIQHDVTFEKKIQFPTNTKLDNMIFQVELVKRDGLQLNGDEWLASKHGYFAYRARYPQYPSDKRLSVSHGLEFFWRKEEFPASVGI
jgi:hypothetical protein